MKVVRLIFSVLLLVIMKAHFLVGMECEDDTYFKLPDPDSMVIQQQVSHQSNLKEHDPIALHKAIEANNGLVVQELFMQGEWLGGHAHPSTEILRKAFPIMRTVITQIILSLPQGKDKAANIPRLLWVLSEIGDCETIALFFKYTP